MKKIICISIVGLVLTASTFAEKTIVDKVFNKYSSEENATVVNMNGLLLKIAANNDEDFRELNISGIKVLAIDDPEANRRINFYDEIIPNLDQSVYKELMRVVEKDQKIVMLLKENGEKIEEFLIVIGGTDNTLVRITGDINRDKFEEYANIADVNIQVD